MMGERGTVVTGGGGRRSERRVGERGGCEGDGGGA